MASTPTNPPGTMGTSAFGAGNWTNPDYAKIDDANYVTDGNVAANGEIPTTIAVKLIKGGTITGNDKGGASMPTTEAFVSYGGATDLWGVTLTSTDVNDSTFGFTFAMQGSLNGTYHLNATNFGFTVPAGATINGIIAEVKQIGLSRTGRVNFMRLTVYYTLAANGNMFLTF